MSLRARLYRQLVPSAWDGAGMSPVNRVVVILILLSVAVAVIETEPTLKEDWGGWFHLANWLFASAFTVEYLARVWANGEDPQFQGLTGRLRYMATPRALIDLAVLIPFYLALGASGDVFVLRLVRVLRLLALARFGRFSTAARLVLRALADRKGELLFTGAIAGTILLVAATALYAVEADAQPEAFGSIPRALWWAVAALTTVGYGDVYPVTPLGRMLGAVTAIAAIGIIAMPAGILAAAMGDAIEQTRKEKARRASDGDGDKDDGEA